MVGAHPDLNLHRFGDRSMSQTDRSRSLWDVQILSFERIEGNGGVKSKLTTVCLTT